MAGKVDVVSGNAKLQQALETVRTNPQESEKFAKDPKGYLNGKGVDTSHLHFGAAGAPATAARAAAAAVCVSVGCIACASIG